MTEIENKGEVQNILDIYSDEYDDKWYNELLGYGYEQESTRTVTVGHKIARFVCDIQYLISDFINDLSVCILIDESGSMTYHKNAIKTNISIIFDILLKAGMDIDVYGTYEQNGPILKRYSSPQSLNMFYPEERTELTLPLQQIVTEYQDNKHTHIIILTDNMDEESNINAIMNGNSHLSFSIINVSDTSNDTYTETKTIMKEIFNLGHFTNHHDSIKKYIIDKYNITTNIYAINKIFSMIDIMNVCGNHKELFYKLLEELKHEKGFYGLYQDIFGKKKGYVVKGRDMVGSF